MIRQQTSYYINPTLPNWLDLSLESLSSAGIAILEGIVDQGLCMAAAEAIDRISADMSARYGRNILDEREDLRFNRLLMKSDPLFFDFIALNKPNQVIDRYLSPKAILRGQISQTILPYAEDSKDYFVFKFHQNFRHMNCTPRVDLDGFVFLNDVTEEDGLISFIPGSHLWTEKPTPDELEQHATDLIIAKAGDYVFIDGMLWHKENYNRSAEIIRSVNHQFVLPIVKESIDHSRALGEETMRGLPELLKQRLGWYSRVPSSLDEYYRPLDDLLYRV